MSLVKEDTQSWTLGIILYQILIIISIGMALEGGGGGCAPGAPLLPPPIAMYVYCALQVT